MKRLADHRQFAAATERNRDAILRVLAPRLRSGMKILEIGSGTGEHAVYFAQALPEIQWQPSERESTMLGSIRAWIEHTGVSNVLEPMILDAATADWQHIEADAVVAINVLHYTPWPTIPALFAGAARCLPSDGWIYCYGAYQRHGQHTAASNAAFDQWLKQRNPEFGVRHLEAITEAAQAHGFDLAVVQAMPANNFSVVFERQASDSHPAG